MRDREDAVRGKTLFEVGLAHLEESPPDPDGLRACLPPGFSAALLAALEKEPEQRPATASDYAALLQVAAAGRPT